MQKQDYEELVPPAPADWDEHERKLRERQRQEELEEEKRRLDKRRGILRDRGFPVRAIQVALSEDLFVLSKAVLAAISKERKGSILVLAGPTGVGKTVAATLWALERKDSRPRFLRAAKFESMSRYREDDRALWEGATSLVLDDLGVEYNDESGNFLRNLDELIDYLYASAMPAVITTNLPDWEFKKRYGQRIWDRISECADWRNVSDVNYRMKG